MKTAVRKPILSATGIPSSCPFKANSEVLQQLLQVLVFSDELVDVDVVLFQSVSVGEQHHGVFTDIRTQHVLQSLQTFLLLFSESSQLDGEEEDVRTWRAQLQSLLQPSLHLVLRQHRAEESGGVHHRDSTTVHLTSSLLTALCHSSDWTSYQSSHCSSSLSSSLSSSSSSSSNSNSSTYP
ncbi:hypothetical protein INR49_007983 [Caranx melampygus]|nr:hypothetical protein INR49_007983 [Caranx melampygus]